MNVLFVLYGGLDTNSAVPLMLHARELSRLGHRCVVAVPPDALSRAGAAPECKVVGYAEALADRSRLFGDAGTADVVHAWTPRECVRQFVSEYQAQGPTPWLLYHEDEEGWIARRALAMCGLREEVLLQHAEEVISAWTPPGLAHPLRYESFIGLADAAVVIQDKLAVDIPPWVPHMSVMPGVDLEFFAPREPDVALRKELGLRAGERVIVYPGGLNDFTRAGIEALCRAVGLVNEAGVPCRLVRSGPVPLDFLASLPPAAAGAIVDLGVLPRSELPRLYSIADAFVQPGRHDPFEDHRLPGKLPELFASGRPVALPATNIAHLARDGEEAIVHSTGTPDELARICLDLFANPERARSIGAAGRRFAERLFDPAVQASRLERAYELARRAHDPVVSAAVWTRDAGEVHASTLLARRLSAIARNGPREPVDAVSMLAFTGRSIERAFEREKALEIGLAVRDRELADLKERVKALEAQLAEAMRRVEELGDAGAILRKALEEATVAAERRAQHIAALESSFSWRVTRPLRGLMDALARMAGRGPA